MQSLEGQYDDCTEQVFEVGLKLEQKEKVIRRTILYWKIEFIISEAFHWCYALLY